VSVLPVVDGPQTAESLLCEQHRENDASQAELAAISNLEPSLLCKRISDAALGLRYCVPLPELPMEEAAGSDEAALVLPHSGVLPPEVAVSAAGTDHIAEVAAEPLVHSFIPCALPEAVDAALDPDYGPNCGVQPQSPAAVAAVAVMQAQEDVARFANTLQNNIDRRSSAAALPPTVPASFTPSARSMRPVYKTERTTGLAALAPCVPLPELPEDDVAPYTAIVCSQRTEAELLRSPATFSMHPVTSTSRAQLHQISIGSFASVVRSAVPMSSSCLGTTESSGVVLIGTAVADLRATTAALGPSERGFDDFAITLGQPISFASDLLRRAPLLQSTSARISTSHRGSLLTPQPRSHLDAVSLRAGEEVHSRSAEVDGNADDNAALFGLIAPTPPPRSPIRSGGRSGNGSPLRPQTTDPSQVHAGAPPLPAQPPADPSQVHAGAPPLPAQPPAAGGSVPGAIPRLSRGTDSSAMDSDPSFPRVTSAAAGPAWLLHRKQSEAPHVGVLIRARSVTYASPPVASQWSSPPAVDDASLLSLQAQAQWHRQQELLRRQGQQQWQQQLQTLRMLERPSLTRLHSSESTVALLDRHHGLMRSTSAAQPLEAPESANYSRRHQLPASRQRGHSVLLPRQVDASASHFTELPQTVEEPGTRVSLLPAHIQGYARSSGWRPLHPHANPALASLAVEAAAAGLVQVGSRSSTSMSAAAVDLGRVGTAVPLGRTASAALLPSAGHLRRLQQLPHQPPVSAWTGSISSSASTETMLPHAGSLATGATPARAPSDLPATAASHSRIPVTTSSRQLLASHGRDWSGVLQVLPTASRMSDRNAGELTVAAEVED
jgi:hypothetical protein